MKVVSKEPHPLDRLTLEGTMISEHRSGLLLNRKGEWGQNLPPQFGILDSEDKVGSRLRPEKKKRGRKEEGEEEVEKTPCKKSRKAGGRKDQPPPGSRNGIAIIRKRQSSDNHRETSNTLC